MQFQLPMCLSNFKEFGLKFQLLCKQVGEEGRKRWEATIIYEVISVRFKFQFCSLIFCFFFFNFCLFSTQHSGTTTLHTRLVQ